MTVWRIEGCISGKRLQPFLPTLVPSLERHGELVLDEETRRLLLQMSTATIDRKLAPFRREQGRGLSTTKAGTLLKQAIPIRTFADWEDARPGSVEMDLVAHCGETTEGQYLNTLTATDVTTAWTECFALRHWPRLVNGIESKTIPRTKYAAELVIRRFDQHYQNFCGFESLESAHLFLAAFEKVYRFTPLSQDAKPHLRGKCPLQLAGYDISQVPMARICAGWSPDWSLNVEVALVPNL